MKTQIRYIPLADKGPHYVETGARPESPDGPPLVICQLLGGGIFPLRYDGSKDSFYSPQNPEWKYGVTCWWHLPERVPATEREWFDKNAPDLGYGVKKHNVDGIQYSAFLGDYDFPDWQEVLREDADDCIEDCYNHWREAGRP